MIKTYMNWSGGKDSALCLHRVLQDPRYAVARLLTSVNAHHDRVSMHGVRRELLHAQAASIGIALETIELPEQPGMTEYERAMADKVHALKGLGCSHAVFGDIFLEDLRTYREGKLAEAGVGCLFPLWKEDTTALLREFVRLGFRAVIVCVNDRWLDRSFCGRLIDEAFVRDLPAGVDPCGENGEYHSFVFDGPIFSHPVEFAKGEIVYREYRAPETADTCFTHPRPQTGFYFCDLLPLASAVAAE